MKRLPYIWCLVLGITTALSFFACGSTSGLINKVKRGDKVYENSCTTFQEDVKNVLDANSQSEILSVSQYENSQYDYFYLEPGQFVIQGDTLLFRLKKDLNYNAYVDPQIAIHASLKLKAPSALQRKMGTSERTLGTIVIDKAYVLRHSRPFFVYQIPLRGAPVAGRQLSISFAIVEYEKGAIKKYFCDTDNVAIGTLTPACCKSSVWESTSLQSVADLPVLDIQPDTFAYAGFRARMDIAFQKDAYTPSLTMPANSLQSLIVKMKASDYVAQKIVVRVYSDILGDATLNLEKTKQQGVAVLAALKLLNAQRPGLDIEYTIEGPDWERVGNLVQTAQSLNGIEKDQVLEVVRNKGSDATKLAKLTLLGFYSKLESEILNRSRHIMTEVRFDYIGTLPKLDRYPEVLSLWDPRLEEQVARRFAVKPFQSGDDIALSVKRIDQILTQKASANLYATRATFMQASKNYKEAIENLEKAARLEPANTAFPTAIRAYKILFADSYDLNTRFRMLEEYDRLVRENPSERDLFFNRAILMEKCGLTSLALREYEKLFEAAQVNSAQLNNRGVANLKAFRLRDARTDFEQAISQNPTLAEPYFNLAVLFAYQGYERKCREALEAATQRDGRFKGLIFNNPAFSIMADQPAFQRFRE